MRRIVLVMVVVALTGACTTTETTKVEILDAWGDVAEVHTTTKTSGMMEIKTADVAAIGVVLGALLLALGGGQ